MPRASVRDPIEATLMFWDERDIIDVVSGSILPFGLASEAERYEIKDVCKRSVWSEVARDGRIDNFCQQY